MKRNDSTAWNDTTAWDAISTADLQDLAALDRLAGQLAPPSTMRRYAHQHERNAPRPRQRGGWQRLMTAVRGLLGRSAGRLATVAPVPLQARRGR